MLEIINEKGLTLDMADDASISVEQNNTLFNEGVLKEDLTYPGEAPITANNKLFFANAQRVDSKRDVFEMQISVFSKNIFATSGIMRVVIKQNGYEFTIKPNYSAVAERSKNFAFKDINFNDAVQLTSHSSLADLENYMKTVAQNTSSNFTFFPYKDGNVSQAGTDIPNKYVRDSNKFSIDSTWGDIVPFFKLSYMLKKAWEFLGFKADGAIFSDPEFANRYLFNNKKHRAKPLYDYTGGFDFIRRGNICWQSAFYMPQEMLVSDFLKYVRDRHHLAYNVNYEQKTVDITSFAAIASNSEVKDFSEYFSFLESQEIAEQKSLKVSLVNSTSNELFADDPEKYMLIGEQINPTEITVNVATTKITFEQSLYVIPYTKIPKKPYMDQYVVDINADIPELTEVKYNGFFAGFPSAFPTPLYAPDAQFYNFLNESKTIKAIFYLPIATLLALKTTDKISFSTKDGVYTVCLIEKIAYDLSDSDFIKTQIQLRPLQGLNSSYSQSDSIVPDSPDTDLLLNYRAYFDLATYPNGITFDVYNKSGSTYVFSKQITIKKPCDKFGAGGDIAIVEHDYSVDQKLVFSAQIPSDIIDAKGYVRVPVNGTFGKETNYWPAPAVLRF